MATLPLEPTSSAYREAESWHNHNALQSVSSGAHSDSSSEQSVKIYELDPEKALTPQISRCSQPSLARRCTTNGTTGTSDPNFEVNWEDEEDPNNPKNWSLWRKGLTLFTISYGTLVVIIYSTSYTTGFDQMMKEFHVNSEPVVTLGVTTYLIGLAVGSLILAPISETYGRRPVYVIATLIFTAFIAPCAKAHGLAEIIVLRFFGACAGSAFVANAPGTVADIITEDYRALAFSIWSIGPLNGPVFGPVLGGFVTQYWGWRWTNWVVMCLAGVSWVLSLFMSETYAPVILQKKAKQKREETGDDRWWCRYDQRIPFAEMMKVNLSRPFIMALFEPICIFWNVYVAIIYGLLYLCFVAYPIVYTEIRGWSLGISGLAFIGIGTGSMMVIVLEPAIRKMINSHKPDPETGKPPPEAAMSMVCIAAILAPIGELWFAWTCVPTSIHWSASILAGIPFGAGNTAVFIYASNYLTGSYGVYSASAMAGNAMIRSILGGTLPLAGPTLYRKWGANWAGTFLGGLEILIIPIPFVFYKYGHRIRVKSPLIRSMQEDQRRLDRKKERHEERLAEERQLKQAERAQIDVDKKEFEV